VRLRLRGIPASPGIVVGPAHLLRWEVPDVPHHILDDDAVPAEIERLRRAIDRARERLALVRARAERHAGPEEAAIFDVQTEILNDSTLVGHVETLIQQNLNAEKAFDIAMLEWRQQFARHPNAMMRERVGDLVDVQIRVLSLLLDLGDHDPVDVPKGACAVLVTHDLTPSLTCSSTARRSAPSPPTRGRTPRTSPSSRGRWGCPPWWGCATRRPGCAAAR
jgi:phosphotransferase system enzyme I (PtsI)